MMCGMAATQKMFGPYPGVVQSVHDGDTMRLDIDLGFGIHLTSAAPSCRIWGINAPELATDAGKVALAYALEICPVGTVVSVVSHGWDKYGRFDGELTLPNGKDFGTLMVESGHAVKYAV